MFLTDTNPVSLYYFSLDSQEMKNDESILVVTVFPVWEGKENEHTVTAHRKHL